MSQQLKMDQFFKKQSSNGSPPGQKNNTQNSKKRNLSLNRLSSKSPRKAYQSFPEIVEIHSSSDENDEALKNPKTTKPNKSHMDTKSIEIAQEKIENHSQKSNLKHEEPKVNLQKSKNINISQKITINTPQEINAKAFKSKDSLEVKNATELAKCIMNTVHEEVSKVLPIKESATNPIIDNTMDTSQDLIPKDPKDKSKNLQTGVKSDAMNSSSGSETSVYMVYNMSPSTFLSPQDSPKTPSKSTPSPGSGGSPSSRKFFSPTKKKSVLNRSPVKRNLMASVNQVVMSPQATEHSETYTKALKGLDDKTAFMLDIIDKCLTNDSLKTLLETKSQTLLQNCMLIPQNAMRLVCRLYWRQPGWYRLTKLSEIASEDKKQKLSTNDVNEMIQSLVVGGLLTPSIAQGQSSLSFDDYMKVLQRPELQQICKELKLDMKSKQNSVEALRAFCKQAPISNYFSKNKTNNNNKRVMDMLKSKTGACYMLSEEARTTLNQLHVLMYLGMSDVILREKKLELVLIYDKILRETYPVDMSMKLDDASVVFETKDEFIRYYKAREMYENYLVEENTEGRYKIVQEAHELYKQLDAYVLSRYMSLPTWLHRYTPANIYLKLIESGVVDVKKQKLYHEAVQILDTLLKQVAFRQHKRAEWYAEKALVLHRWLHDPEKAAEVLLRGLESNLSDEHKETLRSRARLLAKQQNIELKDTLRNALQTHADDLILESSLPGDHIYKNPVDNYNQKGKLKFEIHTDEGRKYVNVEEYCIEYYIAQRTFTHGEHWEGRMINSLFYLLFWDIIYSKPVGVNGVFLSYYQRYPLDLFTESFYVNRKSLIDERLEFIENCTEAELEGMMLKTWEERPEHELSDIMRSVPWSSVQSVARCLGARAAGAICRRLAHNYGYAHSGFPDVTLWNLHTKKIKFVEVKSDADSPSIKQLQWIKYLRQHNIDAAFCYIGANTTRSQARSLYDLTADLDAWFDLV